MTITSLLLYCDDDADYPVRSRVALDLAYRYKAHLLVVSMEPSAENVPGSYGRRGYLGQELDLARQKLRNAEQELREICKRDEIACSWFWEEGSLLECLSRRSYHADLAIVSQTPPNSLEEVLFDYMPDHLAMTGSCPVLILPKDFSDDLAFHHPLVAWKNRRESALALRGALPLLQKARHVSIVAVDPEDGEELLADELLLWLERHSVLKASFEVRAHTREEPSKVLAAVAREKECDYLVMGGYSHSRLREWILGGVTRSFLNDMPLPILMAH